MPVHGEAQRTGAVVEKLKRDRHVGAADLKPARPKDCT
jgi:hypothetical protein